MMHNFWQRYKRIYYLAQTFQDLLSPKTIITAMMKRTKNYAEEILAELRHTHREIAHLRQEVSELKRALATPRAACSIST
jgi:cell shape-determining protein MreC